MLRKLIIYFFVVAIAVQAGRDALTGLWYLANQKAITEQYCVNKAEPLLMCQGKCYLQNVLEEQHQPSDEHPFKLPASEERINFVLPLTYSKKQFCLSLLSLKSSNFYYRLPKNRLAAFDLFHPPRV